MSYFYKNSNVCGQKQSYQYAILSANSIIRQYLQQTYSYWIAHGFKSDLRVWQKESNINDDAFSTFFTLGGKKYIYIYTHTHTHTRYQCGYINQGLVVGFGEDLFQCFKQRDFLKEFYGGRRNWKARWGMMSKPKGKTSEPDTSRHGNLGNTRGARVSYNV